MKLASDSGSPNQTILLSIIVTALEMNLVSVANGTSAAGSLDFMEYLEKRIQINESRILIYKISSFIYPSTNSILLGCSIKPGLTSIY